MCLVLFTKLSDPDAQIPQRRTFPEPEPIISEFLASSDVSPSYFLPKNAEIWKKLKFNLFNLQITEMGKTLN
jgi:hypothetical protein